MTRKAVMIDWEGEVWRFTPKQWAQFCREGANEDNYVAGPRAYGARYVGVIDHRPLDWRPTDFRNALEAIDSTDHAAARRAGTGGRR